MADKSRKPIEEIEVGDEVLATDPETGEQAAKAVEYVFVHDDTVVDLLVDGEVITTTEDHPFWSVTDQRFERADELSSGEHVLSADGRMITVSGLLGGTEREESAYNLSVEGIHTYHVGASEILVHNTCKIPPHRRAKGPTQRLTNSQATDLAGYLGYKATGRGWKGQPVFRKGSSFIVQDIDSHIGGVWKIASSEKALRSKSTRTATTDALLNVIGK